MATVINNPPSEGSGAGTILGIVIVVAIIALVLVYALPRLRGTTANQAPSANINVTLPSVGGSGGGSQTPGQ